MNVHQTMEAALTRALIQLEVTCAHVQKVTPYPQTKPPVLVII